MAAVSKFRGRALLDVYYGKSPVSPQIKEGAAVGFEKMTAAA